MRSDYMARLEEGLDGRELTDREVLDDELEALVDFEDPKFLDGQRLAIQMDAEFWGAVKA